jgi:transcriptional regulator with XRE-family HTH domain
VLTRRTVVLPEAMLVGEQVTLLPEALKAWRKERKLSQRALALAAGCSEGLVSTIESGHRQASIGVAIKIAKALDVTEELPEAS